MTIDPLITKGLWDDRGGELTQVTHESGRYYTDSSGAKYYSVSTIKDKTMHSAMADGLLKWRARVGAEEADRIRRTSAADGTSMHGLIESYLKRGYQIPDEAEGTASGWRLFNQYYEGFLHGAYVIPRLIEGKVFYAPNGYGYAGTVDLVADIQLADDPEPILTIVDHKSIGDMKKVSSRVTGYGEQLAAYAAAVRSMYGKDIKRGVLNFASTRGYKQYMITFGKLEEYWSKFYDKLERFHLEDLGADVGHEQIQAT